MIILPDQLVNRQKIVADVCVIGGGAAGITLSMALDQVGVKVALIESGYFDSNYIVAGLYDGETTETEYNITHARARMFGGSTNHWGGRCRPLDAIDFEKRPWIEGDVEWPIDLSDLLPYYKKAQDLVELPKYQYSFDWWRKKLNENRPHVVESLRGFTPTIFQLSTPTNFNMAYRPRIERSENIQCFIGLNALKFVAYADVDRIEYVGLRTYDPGKTATVYAKLFVLAAGGIESARLLLLSNDKYSNGLGNHFDLVGRYFNDHLFYSAATLVLNNGLDATGFLEHKIDRSIPDLEDIGFAGGVGKRKRKYISSGFAVTREAQQRHRILNIGGWLAPMDKRDLLDKASKETTEIRRLVTAQDAATPNMSQAAGNLKVFTVAVLSEQLPSPMSRVTLGNETDVFEQRKTRLEWNIGTKDKETIYRTLLLLGTELAEKRIGRLKIGLNHDYSTWHASYGMHHMGTTRMSNDEKLGVVDRNLKLHACENLHVASSSVFPTSGYSNPTLTIIALSLRLAKHIKSRLVQLL